MITKNVYNEYVKKKTPNSPILKNCVRAFVVGGIICVIGQGITDISMYFGLGITEAKMLTPILLIIMGGLLTAVGVYDKIGKFAGGGTIVPITGFSNSIISAAIEFKKEGWVMGLGAKIFTIAGPVITYGVVASVVYGIIYWITTLF